MNNKNIEEVVDRQLKAYNQKDYDVFASCYHEDITCYDFETSKINLEMCGDGFFKHYREKFLENPKIHCEVVNRLVHDNLVVDQEIISDYRNKTHREVVVYQVLQGKISKMWFSKIIPGES